MPESNSENLKIARGVFQTPRAKFLKKRIYSLVILPDIFRQMTQL